MMVSLNWLAYWPQYFEKPCWKSNGNLSIRVGKDGLFLGLTGLLHGISLGICPREIPWNSPASLRKTPSFPPLLLRLTQSKSRRHKHPKEPKLWCSKKMATLKGVWFVLLMFYKHYPLQDNFTAHLQLPLFIALCILLSPSFGFHSKPVLIPGVAFDYLLIPAYMDYSRI